jgi:hypothetical protein
MGEASLATRVDQHGRGARSEGVVGDQRSGLDALGRESAADHVSPGIAAHEARSGDPTAQPGQADTGVADDAAGDHLDRIDVDQPSATDRLAERDRSHEDVRHAGAADEAVDVTGVRHGATLFAPSAEAGHPVMDAAGRAGMVHLQP